MKFSKRATQLKGSATMAATLKAQDKIKNGEDIILASVGEPDAQAPSITKNELSYRVQNFESKYGPAQGIHSTRKSIAHWMNELYDHTWNFDNVVISPGSKYSLYSLFQILCDEDDEVIIPAPYWVSYVTLARLSNATIKILDCPSEKNYKLTPELLKKNITDKSKILLLNSPQNPSGTIYNYTELAELTKILSQYPHLYIICDDIYNQLIFSPEKRAPHLLDVFPKDQLHRIVVVHGASKSFALTGWRLGWTMSNPEITDKLSEFQSQTLTCMPDFLQYALEKTLREENHFIPKLKEQITHRYNYVYSALESTPGIKVFKSAGAFYVWLEILDKAKSSVAICDEILKDHGLALVPGASFGCEHHLRFSVTMNDENLKKGVERLKQYFKK